MSRLVVIVGFPRHVESFLKRVAALNLEALLFPCVQILQPVLTDFVNFDAHLLEALSSAASGEQQVATLPSCLEPWAAPALVSP